MDTRNFLAAILPPSGVYLIATSTGQGGLRHKGFTSLEEAARYALDCDAKGLTVYHACASYLKPPYKNESGEFVARKPENWHAAKAFWCDIDCGKDKAEKGKGYATQREGAVALTEWCKSRSLPPPMLVNSGRGIHAYWPLTRALPPGQWVKAATALKSMMQADGLLADPSRTADFASVLRPVGTHNRKDPTRPLLVRGADKFVATEPETFIALLATEIANSDVPSYLAGNTESIDVGYAHVDSSAKLCAEKCKQVAAMRDTQGDVSYEHWRGVIGLVKHSVEGVELVEEWSARRGETGHANTDFNTRYETWTSGPPTCAFFEGCNPEGCRDCPYKGKVKTPLVLGRIVPEPKTETVEGNLEKDGKKRTFEIPELPQGYTWDGSTLCRAIRNKDDVVEMHRFSNVLFYPTAHIRTAEGTTDIVFRVHLPRGVVRDFNLPGAVAGTGGMKMLELLGGQGIYIREERDAMSNTHAYIRSSITKLSNKADATTTHSHFGWQDDGSFLLGTRLFKPTGEQVEVLLSGYALAKRDCFPRPTGDLQAYVDAVDWTYNRRGMEPLQYLMCSMWASPLVDLCEPLYKGIPCAVTGADSGKGKTTAATAALYAYGDASELCIAGEAGATARAQAALLGAVRNLPVLFDEVTSMQSQTLSKLCYALSNGVENLRLQSAGGKVTFSTRESWRLHTAFTGNSNITERLSLSGNTEAEAMRLFEVCIDNYDIPKLDPLMVSQNHATISRNGGFAGEAFIAWLVTHRKEAEQLIRDSLQLFVGNEELVAEPKYRFYRNHMACTLAAAKIFSELGLIKFDLDRLASFANKAVAAMVEAARESNCLPAEEILANMLEDLSPGIATTETFTVKQNEPPYHLQMNTPLIGRRIKGSAGKKDSKYNDRLFLSIRALTDWCNEHRVNKEHLAKGLSAKQILLERKAKVVIGKNTNIVTAQQRCWMLDTTKFDGDDDE
jgi:hypothetical protein